MDCINSLYNTFNYMKDLTHIGKYISLLLRHQPEKENLNMDDYGYVSVNELINKLKISKEDLDWIVENNNKSRYSYNEDQSKIRANQGHSISVILNLEPINPPFKLYHGTSIENKESILKNGLLKMNRQHVHLSEDIETAKKVGLRHARSIDKLIIFEISAKLMSFDGYKIYRSINNVYLAETVPAKYLSICINQL